MFEDVQEIFNTLRKNKLRTFLTGFSMAWGIFMLIVLLGAGNGLRNGVSYNFADVAVNSLTIWPGRTTKVYGGLQAGRQIKLDSTDITFLEKEFSQIYNVSPKIGLYGRNIFYDGDFTQAYVRGVLPNHAEMETVHVGKGQGRFINRVDVRDSRKVIVLHNKTARMLFKEEDPLGKYVTFDKVVYKVVGVHVDANMSQNAVSYIPLTTAQRIYNPQRGYTYMDMLLKGLETGKQNELFDNNLRASLAGKHRFHKDDKGAVYLYNMAREFLQFKGIFNAITLFVWIIGLGTLIAGVVGISNIMLITVKERTKEFGIRKSLGATPGSILRLVMAECLMVTFLFGTLGMMAGIGLTELLNALIGTPQGPVSQESMVFFTNPTVDPAVVLAAVSVLITAGLLAGFMPARRAVQVKPIEALRYE